MQCTNCGTPLTPGMDICPRCGTQLSYGDQAGEVAYVEYGANVRTMDTTPTTPATLASGGMPVQNYPNPPVSPVSQAGPYATGAIQTPPQQTFPPAIQTPTPTTAYPPVRRFSPLSASLLVILLVLLVIGGSGLFYFTTVAHPGELHSQATAVAQTVLTTQAESTAQVLAQASATTAALTPDQLYTRATSGTPLIDDPLNDPATSNWFHITEARVSCDYVDGVYHIRLSLSFQSVTCPMAEGLFTNYAFQVQMTFIAPGEGGLMFNNDGKAAYIFGVDPNGDYGLDILKTGASTNLLNGSNAALNTGINQMNLLTVVAFDGQIYLYANRQLLGHKADSTSINGQIGLFAQNAPDHVTDIIFNNVKVWSL